MAQKSTVGFQALSASGKRDFHGRRADREGISTTLLFFVRLHEMGKEEKKPNIAEGDRRVEEMGDGGKGEEG